jgi:hypothetical protein
MALRQSTRSRSGDQPCRRPASYRPAPQLPGRNKKKNTSLTASAIEVAGPIDGTAATNGTNGNEGNSSISKANKEKSVVITNATKSTMLTLASQMEKLVMIMMVTV